VVDSGTRSNGMAAIAPTHRRDRQLNEGHGTHRRRFTASAPVASKSPLTPITGPRVVDPRPRSTRWGPGPGEGVDSARGTNSLIRGLPRGYGNKTGTAVFQGRPDPASRGPTGTVGDGESNIPRPTPPPPTGNHPGKAATVNPRPSATRRLRADRPAQAARASAVVM